MEPGEAVEHSTMREHLSPLALLSDQNLSPTPPTTVLFSPAKSSASTPAFGADLYPFQEEERPDPVPASRAREDHPPGALPTAPEEHPNTNAPPLPLPCLPPTAVPADLSANTLVDSPLPLPDIVPAAPPRAFPSTLPVDIPRDVHTAVPLATPVTISVAPPATAPAPATSGVPVRPGAPPAASAASPARGSTPRPSARPGAPLGIWAAPTALPAGPPPSLRHVVPADLRDRARLEVLRQQAITRRWLTGSEADHLTFVTAAVHARRVGSDPCALFVAIVRGQRWDLLTDGDEDQARAWLTGPPPRPTPPPAAAPVPALSDDARFVRLTLAILRQEGWSGDPFAAMQQHSPAWTRTRWDAALAEALGRRVGGGLERLGRGLEGQG